MEPRDLVMGIEGPKQLGSKIVGQPNAPKSPLWRIVFMQAPYFVLESLEAERKVVVPSKGSLTPNTPFVLGPMMDTPQATSGLFTINGIYVSPFNVPQLAMSLAPDGSSIILTSIKNMPPGIKPLRVSPSDQRDLSITIGEYLDAMIKNGIARGQLPDNTRLRLSDQQTTTNDTVVQTTNVIIFIDMEIILSIQGSPADGKLIVSRNIKSQNNPRSLQVQIVVVKPPYFMIRVVTDDGQRLVLAPRNGKLDPNTPLVVARLLENPLQSNQMFKVKGSLICPANNPDLMIKTTINMQGPQASVLTLVSYRSHSTPQPPFYVAPVDNTANKMLLTTIVEKLVNTAKQRPPNSGIVIISFPHSLPMAKRKVV
uniref:Uncharacterized protein n=1 Tax=Romanomermis culicivorax TaxID=13658 RepID=A0A915KHW0_ROMCU